MDDKELKKRAEALLDLIQHAFPEPDEIWVTTKRDGETARFVTRPANKRVEWLLIEKSVFDDNSDNSVIAKALIDQDLAGALEHRPLILRRDQLVLEPFRM